MSFDHERPNSANPDEWEYRTIIDGSRVLISKVGGGTLGRSYDGAWHYSFDRVGRHDEGSDLVTGTPHTHVEAAALIAEFMEDES